MGFDRFDIVEAYYMFDTLWGPTEYGRRIHKLWFRPACNLSLETLSENSKAIYGALVRKHERLYVAYERYYRRAPNAPIWPGTYNMPNGDVRAWLRSKGILAAVECYA